MGEERGRSFGMPLNDFIEQVYPQLERSEEHTSVSIPLGVSEENYNGFVDTRRKMFEALADVIMENMPPE